MARYFNTETTARTLTFAEKKVVTFPGRSWSEDIPLEQEGHAGLLQLVKRKVLKRDPLAGRGTDAIEEARRLRKFQL